MISKKIKGFTLIELIVTVTVILVLTTVAAVSFGGTNTKARDNRRMADVEKIKIALELYRQQNGVYPIDTGGTAAIVPLFIQAWPTDPKGFGYYYDVSGSYNYTLDARMEDVGSTTGSYGNNCGGSLCNYRTTNP